MKTILTFILVVIALISYNSCKRDGVSPDTKSNDTVSLPSVSNFLYNIPINHDTLLIQKDYATDFRIAIAGYKIVSVGIKMDGWNILQLDTNIINSNFMWASEGAHSFQFFIKTLSLEKKDTTVFESKILSLKVVANLSKRYVHNSVSEGKLKLVWPQLDKLNTDYFLIERSVGENKQYIQSFKESDSLFIDNYYVGEEANYKISVINKAGGRQNIWNYTKEREDPAFLISQAPGGGFNLSFRSTRYYGNFGRYTLTTGSNYSPEVIFSTSSPLDTVCQPLALFGDDARLWLRCLPKQYPAGVTGSEWIIYGHFLYGKYGKSTFQFNRIAVIDDHMVAYELGGHIFKYDMSAGKKVDSIINENASYGFLRTSPAGKYVYAFDEKIYGSPVYIWSTDKFTNSPQYTLKTDYFIPPISDNLIALMGNNVGLYNATNGQYIYSTAYQGSSMPSTLSSNGQNMLIYDSNLKLCSYINGVFKLIWEESNYANLYQYYSFDPVNADRCYIWDGKKNFSIRKVSDFSSNNSYKLDIESLINIDFYSRKILGYSGNKLVVYNLDNGTLQYEIPANIMSLIGYGNQTLLIGNTIYSYQGIKYELATK